MPPLEKTWLAFAKLAQCLPVKSGRFHGMSSQQAWAQRIVERLTEVGLRSDPQIAAAGGPSDSTMTKIRNVALGRDEYVKPPKGPTWKSIDTAARWEPGSASRLWGGGEPVVAQAAVQMEAQVLEALRHLVANGELQRLLSQLADEA